MFGTRLHRLGRQSSYRLGLSDFFRQRPNELSLVFSATYAHFRPLSILDFWQSDAQSGSKSHPRLCILSKLNTPSRLLIIGTIFYQT
jgi:hypothetical protein